MINKTERIECAWISLMLERFIVEKRASLNSVLFTLDELAERANIIFPALKKVSAKDVKNCVEDLGAMSQNKTLVKGPFESLAQYYRLSVTTALSPEIETIIRYLFVDSTWSNGQTGITIRDGFEAVEEYRSLCSVVKETNQKDNPQISSREAVWIAAATLTYNEYYRSKSLDLNNYYFKQKTISRLAQCFNKNLPIETCNTMAQASCVKGKNVQLYSYLVEGPDSTRRLSFHGEDYQTQPQLHEEYAVLTINGVRTVSEIEKFVKDIYSTRLGPDMKNKSVDMSDIKEEEIVIPIDWASITLHGSQIVSDGSSDDPLVSSFEIGDFSEGAFDDPIKMLEEFDRLEAVGSSGKQINTSEEIILPEEHIIGDDLYSAFFDELHEMKMSYSYKPVLIKAIMENADVDGKTYLWRIIDYFLAYYKQRKESGLVIEKPDSTFVKHFNNRRVARQTILVYPYKRFEMKGMMEYFKNDDTIIVVPEIWDNISKKTRREICEICDIQLQKYYARLEQAL